MAHASAVAAASSTTGLRYFVCDYLAQQNQHYQNQQKALANASIPKQQASVIELNVIVTGLKKVQICFFPQTI